MPTKADRKHLDATVAAFHSHYASDANWGNERWYASLYPALTRPTRYAALVNQYAPRSEVDKVLSVVPEQELQPVELPRLLSDVKGDAGSGPKVYLYEGVPPAHNPEVGSHPDAHEKPVKDIDAFLFPAPQPVPSSSNMGKDLLTYWNLDAASVLSAHLLDVQPNDCVLDLCAAPGGKSVALTQLIFPHLHSAASPCGAPAGRGCLHANELDYSRNKRLAANLWSYPPGSLFETNAVRVLRLDGSDARAVTKFPCGPGGYDRVLLDAPCSSKRHIIHAHVKASAGGRIADEIVRWRRRTSKSLAKVQVNLLMTALRAVKVGGRVMYSACSIDIGENDGVVDKMLSVVEEDKKKIGLPWDVKIELGSLRQKQQDTTDGDPAMDRLTEETKFDRIAVPDHKEGGQWRPLYLCVLTKVPRKV